MMRIPCCIMRGGTSKGAYFNLNDLPSDESARNRLLVALMGGDARQINGLGGGDMLTSKVAMISPSSEPGVDIDYRFAQVIPGEGRADTSPTCGNILSGAGAFAVENGMIAAGQKETCVVVRDINTGAKVEQILQTPGGKVQYEGDCVIAGAPGSAAPVSLFYLEFAGAKTGALFPTGARRDEFDGVAATCIDAAMPTIIAAAEDFGKTGHETRDELQNDREFFLQMEKIRLQAAEKMGLGDARGKVIPKFALVAKPNTGGDIASRYFTPFSAHAAYAVSGGIALSVAALMEDTAARECNSLAPPDAGVLRAVNIEHPSGVMQITAQFEKKEGVLSPIKAGVLRTAKLIMRGEVFVSAVD